MSHEHVSFMRSHLSTRQFLLKFFKAISGNSKSKTLLKKFITDPSLIELLVTIETLLPQFEIKLDEMTTEGNRAAIRGRICSKTKKGTFDDTANISFALGCRVINGKVATHWFIADRLSLSK